MNYVFAISAFLSIPPAQFKLVLDSVIWAFKHTMRNVAEIGLNILYTMLQNVAQEDSAAQSFYQTYYTDVLQHLFSVVTDSSHTAGRFNCSLRIVFPLDWKDRENLDSQGTFFPKKSGNNFEKC